MPRIEIPGLCRINKKGIIYLFAVSRKRMTAQNVLIEEYVMKDPNRNPMKTRMTVLALLLLAVLLTGLGFLIAQTVPLINETKREMSLTPTPIPDWPDSVMQVTPDPDAPTPEPVLRTGSVGQEVKDLQSRLYTLGYYSGEIDGQFGVGTRDAVSAFQMANGLDADGIAGSETKSLLYSPNAKPDSTP